MNRHKGIIPVLAAFFILAAVSCHEKHTVVTEQPEEVLPDDIVELRADQQQLAGILTGPVELHMLSGTLKVSGTVTAAPQSLATVCVPMGGYVKDIYCIPGSTVAKGQTLALIENQDFVDLQQDYLESKNRLEYAEAEFTRHNELYKDKVYSQKNVQEVTADYRSLKAHVKALEQKLMLIGIRPAGLDEDNLSGSVRVVAPIAGFVKTVNVSIGKFVEPSDVLFEIENNDRLLLELTLFEKDSPRVAVGQKVRFFINNETEEHEAVIYQTGKSITTEKTYKVYATLSAECKNVLPGMYVSALIETSGERVEALPAEAIVSFEDKDYIFIFLRDKDESGRPFTEYRMVGIRKGITSDGYTQVLLPEGFNIATSKVVIKGAYVLRSAKKNAGEMAC